MRIILLCLSQGQSKEQWAPCCLWSGCSIPVLLTPPSTSPCCILCALLHSFSLGLNSCWEVRASPLGLGSLQLEQGRATLSLGEVIEVQNMKKAIYIGFLSIGERMQWGLRGMSCWGGKTTEGGRNVVRDKIYAIYFIHFKALRLPGHKTILAVVM